MKLVELKARPVGAEFSLASSASVRMQQVAAQVRRVAPTTTNVFIRGESGTGKEIIAQATHKLSHRCDRPFIAVNCGAFSPHLIES